MTFVKIIAAYDQNRAIGKAGAIPWSYPKDFAHFKRETLGSSLIMGRATWDSIGKPLPGRDTIVLTHKKDWVAKGYESKVQVAHSLTEALALASSLPGETIIAGGAKVYEIALPYASHQILTTIPIKVKDADTFYPVFDENEWKVERAVVEDELVFRWLVKIDRS